MNLRDKAEQVLRISSGVFSDIGDELKRRPMEPYLRVYLVCCVILFWTVLSCSHKAFYYETDTPAQLSFYRMESGELITQDLPAGKKTLKELHICFGTFGKSNEGELAVCLYKNDKLVREWRMDAGEVQDSSYQTFTLGRPVRISDDDAVRFTVQHNYTGLTMEENGLAVLTSPGNSFTTARESGKTGTIENSAVSYFMTLEDTAMRAGVLYPFLFFLILLFAAATLLIDLRRAGIRRILVGTLVLILITEVVSTDLMQQIVREIPVKSFARDSTRASIHPGETWEETFTASKGNFSTLEFSISDTEGRSHRMHIQLTGIGAVADSEENDDAGSHGRIDDRIYYDSDVPGSSIISGGPAGKIIRIDAEDITSDKVFPAGSYRISITNLDAEKTIKLSVIEETLEGETAQTDFEEGQNEGSEGSDKDSGENNDLDEDEESDSESSESTSVYSEFAYMESNVYATASSVTNADSEEGTSPVVIQKLNYALLRRSDLGYRIALRVILLLVLYVLLIGGMLCRKKITTARFFVISATALGIIYLVLMLPWSAPDVRSHFLAANRFSNLLSGKSESGEWTASAQEAAYLPDSWRTEKGGPYYLPKMQDYAFAYEFDKASADILLKTEAEKIQNTDTSSDSSTAAESEQYGTENKEAGQKSGTVQMFADEKMKFYSALNYLPQILGLTAGRALGLGPSGTFSLARLFMLAVYIAACLHAIRITPVGKSVFAAVALLPAPLSLAGSFSYDAMLMVCALCFMAAVFRACKEPPRISSILECAFWAALTGAVKGGGHLILLPLTLMIIAHASFVKRKLPEAETPFQAADSAYSVTDTGSENKKSFMDMLVLILPILCAGIASVLIFNVLRPADGLFQFGTAGSGKLTFSFAFLHPVKFFDMMMAAYLAEADIMITRMGGMMLIDESGEALPGIVGVGLLIVSAVFPLYERDRLRLTKKDRAIMLAVILIEVVTTPMMLLSWTDINARAIAGIHGRYFLPVLPLLLLIATKYGLHDHRRPDAGVRAIGKKCIKWFCLLSCLGVYFMLRHCLSR